METLRKIHFVGKNNMYARIALPPEFVKYCIDNGFDVVFCIFKDGRLKLVPKNYNRIADEICFYDEGE